MYRVHIATDYGTGFQDEIAREAKIVYRAWYGARNPNTLSALELDSVATEAGKRVQDRRMGRLVP